MEKVIVVGVRLEDIDINEFNDEIDELKNLVFACDMEVVDTISQNLPYINKATYVGSGKVEEIKTAINALDAEGVVFNDELTPSQISNLEDILETAIYDRTFLILEIFKRRAKTKEAQLQVELATLKYTLPRLAGLRKGLSRQRGAGGGFAHGRGAGETKLELDRRITDDKISALERELKELKKERKEQRVKRKKNNMKVVSLVGYTNSGKSSTLNAILKHSKGSNVLKEVMEKDMLFATLETSTRLVENDKATFLLTDTVGFVSKLPHQLVEAFKSTLEEVSESDLIIHVVDTNNPNFEKQIEVTNDVLSEIGIEGIPVIYAFNKGDNMVDYIYIPNDYKDAIRISAKEDINIDLLIDMIVRELYKEYVEVVLKLGYDKMNIFYDIKKVAVNFKCSYTDNGVEINCLLSEYFMEKFKLYIK